MSGIRDYYSIGNYMEFYTANFEVKICTMGNTIAKLSAISAYGYYIQGRFTLGLQLIEKSIATLQIHNAEFMPLLLNLQACLLLAEAHNYEDDDVYQANVDSALKIMRQVIYLSEANTENIPYIYYLNLARALRLKYTDSDFMVAQIIERAKPYLPKDITVEYLFNLSKFSFDVTPLYPVKCARTFRFFTEGKDPDPEFRGTYLHNRSGL